MKITNIDISQERKVIINLITSDQFCKEIIPILDSRAFQSAYCRIISEWVVEYYNKYKKAPFKNIKDVYKSKKKTVGNEDEYENISDLLANLSKDWEGSKPNNVEYSISEAEKYLKLRSAEILSEQVKSACDNADPLKAEQLISNYKRVEKSLGEGVSILHDTEQVAEAFIDDEDVLFRFNGAMGDVVGNLGRGDFMSFLAPMKRGKTFMLWYTAEVALMNSLKVVFFTLEMTKKQMIRRAWQSLSGTPRYDCKIKLPYFVESDNEDGKFQIDFNEEDRKGINTNDIKRNQDILIRRFRRGDIRIIALPAFSANMDNVVARLDNLEHYDNFIPDVVIIDYADIVAPSIKTEYRHQIDDTWKRMRRLAQERNILMVTASQAEKSTFKMDITKAHVAEDIRKLAHVTCMVAINQTEFEAKKGVARLSLMAVREAKHIFEQAIILQCLDIGRPCLDSRLRKDVVLEYDDEEDEPAQMKKRARR